MTTPPPSTDPLPAASDPTRRALQQVIDYCKDRWTEADQAEEGPLRTTNVRIAKQSAYSEVMRYVHTLLDDLAAAKRQP